MMGKIQKKDFNPIPIELKKGYATFHHPLLLHGSGENKSDRSRRATVINVFADGTIAGSDETLLSGVPPFRFGDVIDGQFFTKLLDPKKPGFNHSQIG